MKKITTLIILCALSIPAIAQSKKGMHFKDGVWTTPTTESALAAIEQGTRNIDYAVAVLRQKFGKRPSTDIDALADELARLFVEGDVTQTYAAERALKVAGRAHGDGAPYARAKLIFMEIYESLDGSDPSLKARALTGVFRAGGEGMIRDMFHNNPKPPQACELSMIMYNPDGSKVDLTTVCPYDKDPWCMAGRVLARNAMRDSPTIRVLPTDPTPEEIFPYCFG